MDIPRLPCFIKLALSLLGIEKASDIAMSEAGLESLLVRTAIMVHFTQLKMLQQINLIISHI